MGTILSIIFGFFAFVAVAVLLYVVFVVGTIGALINKLRKGTDTVQQTTKTGRKIINKVVSKTVEEE